LVGFATTFAFSCLPTAFALQAREIHRVVVYFLATFAFFRILNFLNINRGVWAFSKIPPIYKDNHNRKMQMSQENIPQPCVFPLPEGQKQ
jgi:hypothetical protein